MNDLFQNGKLGEIMISGKWIVACYGIVLNRGRCLGLFEQPRDRQVDCQPVIMLLREAAW